MTKEYYVLGYPYESNFTNKTEMEYFCKYVRSITTTNLEDAITYDTLKKAKMSLNNYYKTMDKYIAKTLKWRDKHRKIRKIFHNHDRCIPPYNDWVSCFGIDNEPKIEHPFKIYKITNTIDIEEV